MLTKLKFRGFIWERYCLQKLLCTLVDGTYKRKDTRKEDARFLQWKRNRLVELIGQVT